MKTLVILIGLLFLTSCKNHFDKDEIMTNEMFVNHETFELQGKVKSITEISYSVEEKFGKIVKGKKARDYNRKAHEVKVSFDENQNIVEIKVFDTADNYLGEISYEYINNKKSEENHFDTNDNLTYKKIWKFDKKENITELAEYKSNGNLISKTNYLYNQVGEEKEINTYDSNAKLLSKRIYEYDYGDNFKIVEIKSYDAEDSLTYKAVTKYDSNDIRIESQSWNQKDDVKKWKYKHDKNGNMVESYREDEDAKVTWKYDKFGNMTELKNFNPGGSLNIHMELKYEYDNNDNWTKRLKLENNIPQYIVERQIEYYNQ